MRYPIDLPLTIDDLWLRLDREQEADLGNHIPPTRPRFHGDGMVQLYLSKHVRLHVFHPWLPPTVQNARIHDHAWDMHSQVLTGVLHHTTYNINLATVGPFMVNEARSGCGSTGGGLTKCHRCDTKQTGENHFAAGSEYRFPHHEFHEVGTSELSMTVIRKSNYSDLPPRIIAPWDEEADNAFDHNISEYDLWRAIREAYQKWETTR